MVLDKFLRDLFKAMLLADKKKDIFLYFTFNIFSCQYAHSYKDKFLKFKSIIPPPKNTRWGLYKIYYLSILTTTPAPTVLPPSLTANLCCSSKAIGEINFIFNFTVSPGITISVPAGNVISPVTSVVLI